MQLPQRLKLTSAVRLHAADPDAELVKAFDGTREDRVNSRGIETSTAWQRHPRPEPAPQGSRAAGADAGADNESDKVPTASASQPKKSAKSPAYMKPGEIAAVVVAAVVVLGVGSAIVYKTNKK